MLKHGKSHPNAWILIRAADITSQRLKQRYDPKIIIEHEVSDYEMMKSFVWNVN